MTWFKYLVHLVESLWQNRRVAKTYVHRYCVLMGRRKVSWMQEVSKFWYLVRRKVDTFLRFCILRKQIWALFDHLYPRSVLWSDGHLIWVCLILTTSMNICKYSAETSDVILLAFSRVRQQIYIFMLHCMWSNSWDTGISLVSRHHNVSKHWMLGQHCTALYEGEKDNLCWKFCTKFPTTVSFLSFIQCSVDPAFSVRTHCDV